MQIKRTTKIAVPVLVLAAALVIVSITAAVHDLDIFELDRDALDNGGIVGEDWATLYGGGGSYDAFTGVLPDIGTDGGTQFHGGGSKDDLDITKWRWTDDEPLDKDDITNAYAVAYLYGGSEVCPEGEPSGSDLCTEPGDLIVYFGLDRFANNGSAQVGFWFLQNPVGLTNNRSKGGFEFSGSHVDGDVLVQSNFTNGGVISNISVYRWEGGSLIPIYTAQDCIGAPSGDLACATVNQSDQTSPWPYTPKFGSAGTFPQGSFFEGGINLTKLTPNAGCFSGFVAETRSSTPFDSRLKDFVLGDFSLCHIDGSKYLDVNGNGTRNEGEPPLENWEIELTDGTNTWTTYTDADGAYSFENLGNGHYTVSEICPVDDPPWTQTESGAYVDDACGDESYEFDINLDNIYEIADFGNGQPDIAVSKTCPTAVFVGDHIDYEIEVENTGNVELINVVVSDTLLGYLGTVDKLDPGETETFTPFYEATTAGTVDNTASATGEFGISLTYAEVSDSADCSTEVYALTVTKTADEFYRRYFEWDITKSVAPETWDLFTGESGTSEYTVMLDQTGFYENDWQVTGSIMINNPAPIDASLSSVSDDAGGTTAAVTCPSYTVPAGGSLVCTYDTGEQNSLDNNPFGGTNTATATLNNNDGGTTDFTGTVPIDFTEATVELVDEEATVSDTYGGSTVSGTYSGDQTFTYTRTFTCDGDKGQHDNTASFVTNDTPLNDSDDASVTVNCYDLSVSKTADEFYRRYFEWNITKSVAPETWDLFTGESGTSEYTVILDQTGFYENDWQVTGSITINNSHPTRDADLTSLIDNAGGILGTVNCPSMVVPAGGSLVCTYDTGEQDSPDSNPFGDTNTATATQQLYDFDKDGVATADGTKEYSGTAPIDFTEATVELVDEEATVSDTYGGSTVSGTYSGDQTFTYTRTFTCDGDEGQHDNTASFVTDDTPLNGSDDASVTVNCYDLSVSKTADEFYTRIYYWTIDKVVDNPGPILLSAGDSVEVEYTVTVGLAIPPYSDNNWQVTGSITINNSHPTRDADLTSLVDDVGGLPGVVNCPAMAVPAGDALVCSYDSGVQNSPDSNPFGDTNTATATQQLYDFDKDGVATADGTKGYSGTAPIAFGAPTEYIDEQIDVTDNQYGFLGTVNALTDPLPATFTYTRTLMAATDQCGDLQVDNTATFTTVDTNTTGSDDASVILTVPCEGCTPGFWQGGAGSPLWDEINDPDWTASGGQGTNPYIHGDKFKQFFGAPPGPFQFTMFELVSTGGGSDDVRKAARDTVAAYLNASWGMAFPYTPEQIFALWEAALDGNISFAELHTILSSANDPSNIGGYCPISGSY